MEAGFTVVFPNLRPSVSFVLGRYPGGVPIAEAMVTKHAATLRSEESIFRTKSTKNTNSTRTRQMFQFREREGKAPIYLWLGLGLLQIVYLRFESREGHGSSERSSRQCNPLLLIAKVQCVYSSTSWFSWCLCKERYLMRVSVADAGQPR